MTAPVMTSLKDAVERALDLRYAIERSLALCSFCRSGRYNCMIESHRILWDALDSTASLSPYVLARAKEIHGFEH